MIDLARNQARTLQAGAIVVPTSTATLRHPGKRRVSLQNWVLEANDIPSSMAAFDSVLFTAHKLTCMAVIDNELLEDASNTGGVIESSIAKVIALALDYAVLFDSGVALQPEGLHGIVPVCSHWGTANLRPDAASHCDLTRVSYSSSESEMQLFAMHSLVPLCANLEAEMNMKLSPARTQFVAKFDVNSIIRGDQAARYSAYSQGLTAGFLTVADCRSAEDLPFVEGPAELNRPANMLPHEGEQMDQLTQQLKRKFLGEDGCFEGLAAVVEAFVCRSGVPSKMSASSTNNRFLRSAMSLAVMARERYWALIDPNHWATIPRVIDEKSSP